MQKVILWKAVYQVFTSHGSKRRKSRDHLLYFRNRNNARSSAQQYADEERPGRVVPGSVKAERHDAVIIDQKYYFAFPEFQGIPSSTVDTEDQELRELVIDHGGQYYLKKETRSFSPVFFWDGQGEKPLDCLVLIGNVYYGLGCQVYPK